MNHSGVTSLALTTLNAMNEETKKHITDINLSNLATCLNAEVKHITCTDYTGKVWKKIELIYDETESV